MKILPNKSGWVQLGIAALIAVVLGGIASKWIIYTHPQTESKTVKNLTRINSVARNVVRTTRTTTPSKEGPIVTVVEERDLSTTNTNLISSSLVSSLSTPILPTVNRWGLSVALDPFKGEYWGGASYQPFGFLPVDVEVRSNFRDRVLVGGALRF